MFYSLEHSYFGYCFGFRASNFEFLTEKRGFRSSTTYIYQVNSFRC
jgi:hypothetical protein